MRTPECLNRFQQLLEFTEDEREEVFELLKSLWVEALAEGVEIVGGEVLVKWEDR